MKLKSKLALVSTLASLPIAFLMSVSQSVYAQSKVSNVLPTTAASQMPIPMNKIRGGGFPDFGHMVSQTDYQTLYANQPIFSLKTDFPKKLSKELPDFMRKIDFKINSKEYLMAAQAYAFDGNLPEFGSTGKVAWDPYANKTRNWYHIPWLHSSQPYPPNGGTEGFRGLIKETSVSPLQLSATQNGTYQVYAITLINEPAGYTMGQMWKDPNNPDPRATDRRYGGGFALGTVFAKFLFTDAPANQGEDPTNPADHVDFLKNGVEWQAYITQNWTSNTFTVKTVRLLQMDMMMRDPRADSSKANPAGTGWVFGTFVYNGAVGNTKSKFLNLVPLGVMWGNDPENKENNVNPYPPTRPIKDIINPKLKQQKVFAEPFMPPQHLGWNSRLNGPADLNTSSCMSCHNMGQYPSLNSLVFLPGPPNVPPAGMLPAGGPTPPTDGGSEAWMQYFKNQQAATPFNPKAYSTDMSMQVMISLQNFYTMKGAAMAGQWSSEFVGRRDPNSITR